MTRWIRYVALLWMSMALMAQSGGRTSVFQSFNFEDQPYGALTCMAQDREGILWLGTENGLIRYDGSRFQRIEGGEAFPYMAINSLMAHRRDGLWIGTNRGLVRFRKGKFTLLAVPAALGDIYVGYFGQDVDGTAWIPMPGASLRSEGDRLVEDPGTSAWKEPTYIAHSPRFGGVIALDGQKRFFRREKDGRWIQFAEAKELAGLVSSTFAEDGDGTLWIGEGRQLWALPPGKTRFESRSHLLPEPIRYLDLGTHVADGSVVFFTENGLLRLRGDQVVERLDAGLGLPEQAYASLTDRDGNLWLTGMNLYRRLDGNWFQCQSIPLGPKAKAVWSLLEEPSGGRLWAACPGGVALFEQGRWRWFEPLKDKGVGGIARSPDGTIWFTSYGVGMWKLPPGATQPVPVPGANRSELADAVLGPDGRLYLSLWQLWLISIDPSGKKPSAGVTQDGLERVPNVGQMKFDTQGRLWVGSALGLGVLDGGTWRMLGRRQGLPGRWVRRFAFAKDGTVWLAYNDPIGLTHVQYQEGQWKVLGHYDSRSGLPSNVIYDIAFDGQERLWIGTNLGLVRWDGQAFRAFGRKDGLASIDIVGSSMVLDAGGNLLAGTSNGFLKVMGSGPPASLERPSAVIRELETAGRSWYLAYETPGALPPGKRSLTFHFAAEKLAANEHAHFQVRLMGLDDLWRDVDEHQAHYPSVPPGEYTFQVRAAHRPGDWGPEASLPVELLPRWYGTLWARVLWASMAALAIYGVVRLRMRQLLRQRDHLEALVRSRTQEIETARDELQHANEALQALSLTDPLTGLRNRRYFELVVEDEAAKAVRAHQSALLGGPPVRGDLVFFLVDLDHFKSVNDTYGHDAGDKVLVQAAQALLETVREMDAVVRWGGEEFLILARDTERSRAPGLAERIRDGLASRGFPISDHAELRVTCSVGFSIFPLSTTQPDLLDWRQTMVLADRCLYGVKRSGRNGWAGFMEARIPAGHGISWVDGPVEELRAAGVLDVVHSPKDMKW